MIYPEYESAAQLSRRSGKPYPEIYQMIAEQAKKEQERQG